MKAAFLLAVSTSCLCLVVHGNLFNFADMIQKVTGKNAGLYYIEYGCFCGQGGTGQPLDATDRCCRSHDCCYTELDGRDCKPKFDSYEFSISDGNVACGRRQLSADDNTTQQSQSPTQDQELQDKDSQDLEDDELEAGPSGAPGSTRSLDPIPPSTTSAATTPALQTPVVTSGRPTTTTTPATTSPVPGADQPTLCTVAGRANVRGNTVVGPHVRGSRSGVRGRVAPVPAEEVTPSLEQLHRVIGVYERAQGQSGRSEELMRELILLMRSIDQHLGQLVDLMGQQVAVLRDRPGSQTTPPPPTVVPQEPSTSAGPVASPRGESSDATSDTAGPPPPKRRRGRPKRSLGVTGGNAPTTRQSPSQP